MQLERNQEVALLLVKHPTKKNLYLVKNYYDAVPVKEAGQLAEVKKYAKLLAAPMKGLKSKDADDRYATAAMLISRYSANHGVAKTRPVPADESKLILTTLAECDWAPKNPTLARMNPHAVFVSLGLTAKDGWTQPKEFDQVPAAAKKWLADNAAKFRLEAHAFPGEGTTKEEPGE